MKTLYHFTNLSKTLYSVILILQIFTFYCSNAQKLYSDKGQVFDFKNLKQNKASIIIFFDPECPICEKYTKNIIEMDKKYRKEGIEIYIIYPFKILEAKSLSAFRDEFKFDLPIIYDPKRKLLKKLKANYSPEVFLLDNKQKTLYHGAIDNWFYGLGRNRVVPTEFYLLDAINAFKNNQNIKFKYVEPVGCML
jgi:thioredoxin-related protein